MKEETIIKTPFEESYDNYKKEHEVVKVDLACGNNKSGDDFFGVDISSTEKSDAVVDLELYPWPFDSDSIDEIVCNHYIEHVTDLMQFMNEIYRILKPGGKVKFVAPYYTSIRCWQDPTHKHAISEATFLYYNKEWRTTNKLDHYPIDANFDYVYGYDLDALWANRAQEARDFAIKHYWNTVSDIHVTMTSRKGLTTIETK